MTLAPLQAGFLPLVDAVPLVVAREIGFARDEGLDLQLARAANWSLLRDWVAAGQVEAAHMLAPVPVATALGLGGMPVRLSALSVLSVNGSVVGIGRDLSDRLRAAGHDFGFADAETAGRALLAAAGARLRIAVPFPFSIHAELLRYWLETVAGPQTGIDIRTVPPPLMADALTSGAIDAFCVGEPWGSLAVERGLASLLLPGRAIWARAPDKVLAVREDWAQANPEPADRLVRALWRAGRWLAQPDNRATAADILSRPEYLDIAAEIAERALTGRFAISSGGEQRRCAGFVSFHDGAAGFPWRSQAAWIGDRLAARTGMDAARARKAAAASFRPDICRRALAPLRVDLPGASEKLEGAIAAPTEVASASGTLILAPDRFFDGRIFDPGIAE